MESTKRSSQERKTLKDPKGCRVLTFSFLPLLLEVVYLPFCYKNWDFVCH